MTVPFRFVSGIYKHYKGSLYRVINLVYLHDTNVLYVVYYKCNDQGIFKSLRTYENNTEVITPQPFIRSLEDFNKWVTINFAFGDALQVKRFSLIKEL